MMRTLLTYGLAVALSQENPQADRARAALASGVDVPIERTLPKVKGHPVTAVVVTQGSQLVAVYLTMADGKIAGKAAAMLGACYRRNDDVSQRLA